MTLYEITTDLKALDNILESLVDENDEPREPTADEYETLKNWFNSSQEEFQKKFDNYCRYIKNLKISAENVEGERNSYKKELDRLSKRANTFENKAKLIQGLLRWNMETLKIKKYQTIFFNAGIQNTQKQVSATSTCDFQKIPNDFLKKRELDTTAIKNALKDGTLIQKEGDENYGKLFFKETGEVLKGVICTQGSSLVIR